MDRKYVKNFGPQGFEHPGCKFQIKLLVLCLLKGFESDKKFKLSTGNKNAALFNDIIFETIYGDILMRINYKDSTRSKPLNYRQLLGQTQTFDSLYDSLNVFTQINQSTFRIRNVQYVTNIRISRSEIMVISFPSKNAEKDDVSALRDEYYILGENCREILRKGKPNTSEEHLSDFLSKFQLVSISEKMVNEEIRRILEKIEISDSEYLPVEETINYLVEKITRWFSDWRSSPLENHHAAAFLSEFRSSNFSKTLKRYNVSFKTVDEQQSNRVLHLVNEKYYVLSLLKFYQKVFETSNNWIFVDPDERLSVRRVMVEAFLSPENRFLVVPIYGQSFYGDLRIDELLQGISDYEYKRIAFFSDHDEFLSRNVPNIRIIESRVVFEDLEDNCKNTFLDASVDFQGNNFSLRDVIGPEGNTNEIIDEETLLKLSTGENIKIEKLYTEEDIGSLYIDRSFVRDEKTFSERHLCDLVVANEENKFILISEVAGMGKSTALTRITRILNEQPYPRFWVIRLNFNRYANVFRKLIQDTDKPIEIEDILNFERPIFQNSFDKSLFSVTNKVLLLIDGVDVRSSHENRVIQFLKNSADRTNISRIILTTRPHLESLLEKELRVSCFKLQLFSSEDQVDFLAKYWKSNLKLSQRDALRAKFYARNLTGKLYRKIGRASLDFVGIPLQTKMIAEIFQEGGSYENFEWKGCRQFLTSQNVSAEMSEDINVARLYDIFVKKKGDIFINKCEPRGHVVVEDVIQNLFQESLDVHKKIALESVLDSEKCNLFAVYRNTIIARSKQYLENMGLVQRIETAWLFVHQTFAEYFVSSCLWDELRTGNESWPFLHFLVSDVLVSPEFSVVRTFLDNVLMDVHIPEEILSACGSIVGQISWHEHRNIVHLAKEGLLNILQLLLEKCNIRSYLLQIENIRGEVALHEAVENPRILEYLVVRGANVDRANSRGQTALHRASEGDGCADAADFLIRAGAEVDIKLKDGKTALHCAAQKNSFKVAAILIAGKADLNATEQTTMKTPLHLAAENDSLEVARLLIKAGAKILAKTRNQQTALELAQLNRSYSIIKLLKDELHPS